jgi:D-amino-acid dehydrogenase
MRVVVLGSGVVGVTSAWYLAQAGHEVVVIERQSGAALETSFANAGEISPGYASPWAAPGIPIKALRWLSMKHAPLILRPRVDLSMLRWLVAMLGNCNARDYAVNKSRMVRLAEFSRDCLMALRAETGIAYDERSLGTLQLFREEKQLVGISKDVAVLAAGGVPFEVLDRQGCIAAEPGLAASRAAIAGGLRLPNDETGDCFKFTNALAARAAAQGVEFRYDTKVTRVFEEGGKIVGVETDKGPVAADAYLVAMGSFSPQILAPLGVRLPVYPVKGYSLTVPIVQPRLAPVSTLLDESYKVAITRLGERIRIGGMAEISGFSRDLPPARRATLEHSARSLFPGSGDFSAAHFWCGLRPMTPDSTPVIGPTRIGNLFLNTGHGTLGWTMACGSAHVIADIIGNRRPAIEAGDLSIARY